jgi:serine/threonine protein kinase
VRHKFSRNLTAKIKIEDTEETKLRVLDMKKLTKIASTLTMALCLLRKEGAIHADIKPENCFIRTRGKTCDEHTVKREGSDPSRAYSSTESSLIRHCSTSILLSDTRRGLPDDFDLQLGDFGNSIHMSDVGSYYTDFDLQTLSYRAPEVLLGVPFGYQIDIWSLGILLIEVCIGKPLFIVRSRKELYDAMCTHLTAPPRVRFAGGMYSDLLTNTESSRLEKFDFGPDTAIPSHPWNTANTKINFSEHLSNVKRLLDKHIADPPNDLIHYLAGLVNPDPDHRLTAMDAIRHPFVSASVISPLSMIGNYSL